MEISEQTTAAGRTLALKGRFDAHQVAQFKARLEPLNNLTLDFAQVNFIDSTGLAMLVSLFKQLQAQNLRLRIVNLQDQVRVIFEITRLHMVLPLEFPVAVS
jgi:anti-sigma B factor antagonist